MEEGISAQGHHVQRRAKFWARTLLCERDGIQLENKEHGMGQQEAKEES